MESREYCPARTTSGEMVTFMLRAWAHLGSEIRSAPFKRERTGDDRSTITTDSYGSATVGFTVREEHYELDRGHYTETQTSLSAATYGLANHQSLKIEHFSETVRLSVHTGDSREGAIAGEFDQQFDKAPTESDVSTVVSRAQIALRQGRWAEALHYGHSVLEHRPKEPDALLAVGVASGASGDFVTAEIALTDLLEARPGHVDALYNLALLRRSQGRETEGLALFERALMTSPANHTVLFQRATTLETLGRLDEARAGYQQAIAASPNPGKSWGFSGKDFTDAAVAALARLPE